MTTTASEPALRRFDPLTAGNRRPVLLLHGFASDGASDWVDSGFVEALTAAGRVALVPDLPGHGRSAAPRSRQEASVGATVRALTELVAEQTQGPVDVLAYSLGARLAWELPRARGIEVSHLVLGGISPGEPFAAVDTAGIRQALQRGETPADPFNAMFASMVSGPGLDPYALLTCIDGLGSEPFDPRPGDVGVPTLFVAGSDDPMTDGIADLVDMVPGAFMRRVPGDHGGALHSAEFRKLALEFIGAGDG